MSKTAPQGYLAFVFHSHLPYVIGHGTWPHGVDWLYQAAAETYLPLLDTLHELMVDGVTAPVTVGITPVLAEQLADTRFKDSFAEYLHDRVEAAASDAAGFREHGDERMAGLADWWHGVYERLLDLYLNRYHRDIVGAFRELHHAGAIEIITCAATHGYLPLLGEDACVRAQVHTGAHSTARLFGATPHGIWLPECAYRPAYDWTPPVPGFGGPRPRVGVEQVLQQNGIEYTIVDAHLVTDSTPLGTYWDRFDALKALWEQSRKHWKPLQDEPYSPNSVYQITPQGPGPAVHIFVRDPQTSYQVWSAAHGYPGDPVYLEFHKKNFPGGIQYWRVTGPDVDLGNKDLYNPENAQRQTELHADHFVDVVRRTVRSALEGGAEPAIVTAPFDTELFGHWWAEGPRWLGHVLRRIAADPDIEARTLGQLNAEVPPRDIINIPEGSWGEGGFHNVWFNPDTEWTWPAIYGCEQWMIALADAHADSKDALADRLLNQLARTLLLLESSDWQFLITTFAARDYAELRFANHRSDFERLAGIAERALADGGELTEEDDAFVCECETRDRLFEDLDFRWWARGGVTSP